MKKIYDKEFKMVAVRLIIEDNMPLKEAANQLDVHQNSLSRWVNEYKEHGDKAFLGQITFIYSCKNELKKLKQINQLLCMELEELKKVRSNINQKNY